MKKHFFKITGIALIFALVFIFFSPVTVFSADSSFKMTDEQHAYLDSIKPEPVRLWLTTEILSFKDAKGNPTGLLRPFIDLLESWGLTVEVVSSGWSDAMQSLESGEADLVGLALLSDDRDQKYFATNTLYTSHMDVYTRRGEPLVNIVNLDHKIVGMLESSILQSRIRGYFKPNTTVRYYRSTYETFEALESGEIDCVVTALNSQYELLEFPNIHYEMSIESVRPPQGIYTSKPEMQGLINLINAYLDSADGADLIQQIKESRTRSILIAAQDMFSDDIKYVQENYDKFEVYDSGVLYPLCYRQNGEYKGLQIDINNMFYELTGREIVVRAPEKFENGFISAIEEIRAGTLSGATSVYYNNEYKNDPDFMFSDPVMIDTLEFYSVDKVDGDIYDLRVATTKFAAPYADWPTIVKTPPVIFGDRGALITSLKQRSVDTAFLSQMAVEYYYMVQKDYSLNRVGNTSASAQLRMLQNSKDVSFNRLFDKTLLLYELIHPEGRMTWLNATQNDKFTFMRMRSTLDKVQLLAVIVVGAFALILALTIRALRYQLRRFSSYDKQISDMLCAQQNVDMIWGDLDTGEITSKGSFPIYRKWGFSEYPDMSYQELAKHHGMLDWGREAIREISENRIKFLLRDSEVISPKDGSMHYLRCYAHKIDERQFMAFALDITNERTREEELKKMANTDYLSELLNRRAMDAVLADKMNKLKVSNETKIFVMMLDIDDFKVVNDSYGHQIGDSVLMGIARIIKVNAVDFPASRWGGEEFLVITEFPTQDEAMAFAEKILSQVSANVFHVANRTSFTVTISCGVSELSLLDDSFNEVIKRADMALYQAKAEGKNCVRMTSATATAAAANRRT